MVQSGLSEGMERTMKFQIRNVTQNAKRGTELEYMM